MPNYEYRCAKCGPFEQWQSIKEELLSKCPKCGSKKVERLISGGVGFVLKGAGFYQNDHKSPSRTSGEAKDREKPKAKDEPKPDCGSCEKAPVCPAANGGNDK
jgi:putative FmdB family regulatory protein